MSSKFHELREELLSKIIADVDSKLRESVANFKDADLRDEDIETVTGKYLNSYRNYLTTAFDIAFQQEFQDSSKSQEQESESQEADDLNLSVTDDDLQKLDDANSRNAFLRKIYPAKCNLLLDRSLKTQIDSSLKQKTNVHAIELIEGGSQEAEVEPTEFMDQLSREKSELRTSIKENLDKLRRLENAQKILIGNQQ